MLDSATAQSEHVEITRELRAEYRRGREQQASLREQQHNCELSLQRPEYLTPEQKEETLARYSEVTRDLSAVTRRLNELVRDPQLRAVLEREENAKNARAQVTEQKEQGGNPWALAKPVPDFLAEEEKEFQGLAKDMLAPGAITLIAAPRGLGKTQVSHALAVALATGGVFRGERVQPVRVLLLDRDNPESIIKKRLRAWGAAAAPNLRVLTRQDAPELKDKAAWAIFPVSEHDVLVVDSVGSAIEGVTEKEGKQTTEVLATLVDLARQGPGLLLLVNCTKDALTLKGRGDWADRADIVYEVRDATGFTPSGKKAWWQELPEAGEAAWADRAARRKGRIDFRLAFVPSKFRLGPEPDPFCLELHLPEHEAWTLRDVTAEILKAGEESVAKAEHAKSEKIEKATEALLKVVKDRAATGEPILKKEAETFLSQGQSLSQKTAREVINNQADKLWKIQPLTGLKGHPQALLPLSQTGEQPKSGFPENPHETRASREGISVGLDKSSNRNGHSTEPASNGGSEDELFRSPGKSRATEMEPQKTASNGAPRDTAISVDDEVETEEPEPEDTGVIE